MCFALMFFIGICTIVISIVVSAITCRATCCREIKTVDSGRYHGAKVVSLADQDATAAAAIASALHHHHQQSESETETASLLGGIDAAYTATSVAPSSYFPSAPVADVCHSASAAVAETMQRCSQSPNSLVKPGATVRDEAGELAAAVCAFSSSST